MTINFSAIRIQPQHWPVLAVMTLLLSFYASALMAAGKDTADLAISDIESKLEQIEQQLEQMHLGSDEKSTSIVGNDKAIKQLKQDLKTLSGDMRANTTELNAQKSLIEDNSVRLYDILIRISNTIETIQALENKLQQNEQPRIEIETVLEDLGLQLQQLWTLLLLVPMFLTPLAFTLTNSGKQQQSLLLIFTGLVLGYLLLGFGLMYGATYMGWVGSPVSWFTDTVLPETDKPLIEFMLYQTALVVFAGLVIHTAIKQHFSSMVQLLLALFVAVLLMPIFGHWLWAEQFIADNNGLLQGLGFVDESKITTLGLLAAGFASILLWRVPSVTKHQTIDSKPVYSAGTALLFYLVWLGFTADVSSPEGSMTDTALTMLLAASAGSLCVFIQQMFFYPNQDNKPVAYVPGGFISGLVAIATCVQSVTFIEALFIGAIAGPLYRFAFGPISRLLGQDAGLIAIHLVVGIWGLLCVALFGTAGNFTFPDMMQLTDQLQGIGIALVYSAVMAILVVALFTWRKKTTPTAD